MTNINANFDSYLAKQLPGKTPAERRRTLERASSETRASIEYAYNVRENFGCWDQYDPVANAIILLAEAQNLITAAINLDAETGDGKIASFAVARVRAIIGLVDALAEAVDIKICGTLELERSTLIKLSTELTDAAKRLNDTVVELR